MKVLITGGKGNLATILAKLFKDDGWEVDNPCRLRLDLSKWNSVCEYFSKTSGFDAVIHTANKGSTSVDKNNFYDLIDNIKMFENLSTIIPPTTPIIILGSGAEFDRRYPILNKSEDDVWATWPIDQYGLSKNIISKRALKEYNNIHVLRLFGCFHKDEIDSRFIKSSINNLKNKKPIQINQDRYMDFFSADDLYAVIKFAISHDSPMHVNLVYSNKKTLFEIANMIHYRLKVSAPINIVNTEFGNPYTGTTVLGKYNIPLMGLENSINKMVDSLI